jgi:Histidine kinase
MQQSFKYYEKVSTLSDSLNYTYGKSLAQINLALLLFNSANFDASNIANFKAIDYAEECGALRLKSVALNNIGENFRILNDFSKCREYTNQAIAINKSINAIRGVANNYELLQQCDLKQELYGDAKKNLDSGISYALASNDSYIISMYYVGYGKLHAVAGRKDSASYYFDKALDEARKQNDERNKYQAYVANVEYLKDIPIPRKIILLDSAYAIAWRTGFVPGVAHSAKMLSDIYEHLKNKDSSFAYFRIYRAANDSIFSENNKRNVIILESNRQIRQKEVENKHLQDLATLQKRDLVFKNALLLGSLILLILSVIIAFVIYKNIQSNKKRTESAFKQNIAEVQMRSLRSQMNPHFIFNSLNSIENYMLRNEKNKAVEYLNKFSSLIRIILNSSRIEFFPFIKDFEGIQLYVELEQLRFNNKFCYKTDVDPELMNGDYKVPSLLIQPYVENAIIHGLSQSEAAGLELKLAATLQDDYITYIIEDNGIGRVQSQKYKQHNKPAYKSLGMQLTQERIDIINRQQKSHSTVAIEDLYDEWGQAAGTRVNLTIKAL